MPTYKPSGDQRYKPKVDAWIEREVGFPKSGPSAVEALMDRTFSVRSETLPVNPIIVAEQLGCRVRLEDIPAARLEATPRGKVIRIPKNAPTSAQRFSVAHEVGHLLFTQEDGETLRPVYEDETLYSENGLERFRAQTRLEHLCNTAARILLIPRDPLLTKLGTRSDITLDRLLEFSQVFDVRPSVLFDRLVDVDFFPRSSLLVLLEYRPNRFTGRDSKWRVASRLLPYKHPFDSFFWENQSVERHGIEFPVPAQPAGNPSSTRFKIGEKEWTMYPHASETSPYWVLARLETAPAERNLMLFPV
jgi:hypothetical protein